MIFQDVEGDIWKSGDDDETEKTLVLYLKDETVLDLCDDGAFSSEQGDFERGAKAGVAAIIIVCIYGQ